MRGMRSERLSGRRRRRGRVCWVGCVLCHGVFGEAVLRWEMGDGRKIERLE
jgi:hypothetical protein